MSMERLNKMNGVLCSCGKIHSFASAIHTGSGVIQNIPCYLQEYHPKKIFVLCDKNTLAAAGEKVCSVLDKAGVSYVCYTLSQNPVEPDEYSVGSVITHYDYSCDMIIAVGSGVINDIGKILSCTTGNPYMIVATAPSMDGYASASSSMTRDGLKISLPTRSADVIVGDTDILCQAPIHMMRSGLGDMLAKYVSICEWRIAKIIAGEYYCEQIAQLIRDALQSCVTHADGLLKRDPAAVQAVFEGLVIGGVAMNYAGLSRPASGGEHYLSHVLDMRGVSFGSPVDLHGIQCAIGTLIHIRLYEKLKGYRPDKQKALSYVESFNVEDWFEQLRMLCGKGAEAMIALENKEQKYSTELHKLRLDQLIDHWDEILNIIAEELPSSVFLEALLDRVGVPKSLEQIGTDLQLLPLLFQATKDIRDKYVLARLLWDLGIIEEFL